MAADAVSTSKRATWIAGFAAASGLNFLSLSGIADAVVDWRCFLNIDVIVSTYQQLRRWLFDTVPISVPEFLQHYFLITASFGAMLNGYSLVATGTPYSIGYGLKNPPWSYVFATLFYAVPWVFLIWTAWTLVQRSTIIRQYGTLEEIEELEKDYRDSAQKLSRDRRTYVTVVVLYPMVCLAALFMFSDFAYKVFGAQEIGGIPFERSCQRE